MVDRPLIIKIVAGLVVLGAAATAYFECGSSSDSGPGLYQHRTINKPPGMLQHGPPGAWNSKSPDNSKSQGNSK